MRYEIKRAVKNPESWDEQHQEWDGYENMVLISDEITPGFLAGGDQVIEETRDSLLSGDNAKGQYRIHILFSDLMGDHPRIKTFRQDRPITLDDFVRFVQQGYREEGKAFEDWMSGNEFWSCESHSEAPSRFQDIWTFTTNEVA